MAAHLRTTARPARMSSGNNTCNRAGIRRDYSHLHYAIPCPSGASLNHPDGAAQPISVNHVGELHGCTGHIVQTIGRKP